jgi:hypothetical protein
MWTELSHRILLCFIKREAQTIIVDPYLDHTRCFALASLCRVLYYIIPV